MGHMIGLRRRRARQILSIALAALLIGSVSYLGVRFYNSSDAATPGTIYLTPASGSFAAGSTMSVTVREESGSTAVNSAQFFLNYNSNQLQYLSVVEGGDFTFEGTTDTSQAGLIRVHRGMESGSLTGDHPIVTINFKVLASSGSTSVTLDKANSSLVGGGQNILQTVTNGTYTLTPLKDATFSFSPNSGSLANGSTFSVAIRVKNPSQKIFSAQPIIAYPAGQLQYIDTVKSASFPTATYTGNTSGTLDLVRNVPLGGAGFTGDDVVVTVNFKVIGTSGSIPLSFKAGSGVYDGNGENLLGPSGAANYTIASTTALPPTTNNPQPPAATNPVPSTGSTPPKTSSVYKSTVTYTPRSGGSAAVNGGNTEVRGGIELAPVLDPEILAKNPGDSIAKVEYYLGKERVANISSAPFTYNFDTTKLQNGAYTISIITTYKSGSVDTATDRLLVNNPVTLSYVMVHYGEEIVVSVIGLIFAVFVIWKYVWPRFAHGSGPVAAAGVFNGYVGDIDKAGISSAASSYVAPEPQVVAPSGGLPQDTMFDQSQAAAAQATTPLDMQGVQTFQPAVPAAQAQPAANPSYAPVPSQQPSATQVVAPGPVPVNDIIAPPPPQVTPPSPQYAAPAAPQPPAAPTASTPNLPPDRRI